MNKFIKHSSIKIFPAIDLLNGEAVRLHQGSFDNVISYSKDPLAVARQFEAEGAEYLHLVDLDAARRQGNDSSAGRNNREQIRKICAGSNMLIEVGGGIRSSADVQELIDFGVSRLVIGTVLVKDPKLVSGWVQHFHAEFIAGIDARDGEVRIAGWESGSGMSDKDVAAMVGDIGMRSIIYTNISKDGTLRGPDIEGSMRISRLSGLPVTISGGMSSMDDCRKVALAATQFNASGEGHIDGVIIGKALYEGSITVKEAIQKFRTGWIDSYSKETGR